MRLQVNSNSGSSSYVLGTHGVRHGLWTVSSSPRLGSPILSLSPAHFLLNPFPYVISPQLQLASRLPTCRVMPGNRLPRGKETREILPGGRGRFSPLSERPRRSSPRFWKECRAGSGWPRHSAAPGPARVRRCCCSSSPLLFCSPVGLCGWERLSLFCWLTPRSRRRRSNGTVPASPAPPSSSFSSGPGIGSSPRPRRRPWRRAPSGSRRRST